MPPFFFSFFLSSDLSCIDADDTIEGKNPFNCVTVIQSSKQVFLMRGVDISFIFSEKSQYLSIMTENLFERIDKQSESPYPVWALSAFSNINDPNDDIILIAC